MRRYSLQALVEEVNYVAEENLAEVIQWFEEKKKLMFGQGGCRGAGF